MSDGITESHEAADQIRRLRDELSDALEQEAEGASRAASAFQELEDLVGFARAESYRIMADPQV